MKTIAIIATGGTIAGTGKDGKTVAYHAGEIGVEEMRVYYKYEYRIIIGCCDRCRKNVDGKWS